MLKTVYYKEGVRVDTDKGNSVALAMLDLSKAIDCINHNVIQNKILSIGFEDTSYEVLSSFVSKQTSNRKSERSLT